MKNIISFYAKRTRRAATLCKCSLAGAVLYAGAAQAQPVISSLSAASGSPGSVLTISGSGFNTSPGSNAVHFGATRAAVNSASATTLTVQVPAGASYMPVSVTNTATMLAARSQSAFIPTFNNSLFLSDSIRFARRLDIGRGLMSAITTVADVDGDSRPDIISGSVGSSLTIMRNSGTPGYLNEAAIGSSSYTIGTAGTPNTIIMADMNGDGKPDMVVCNSMADAYVNTVISVYISTATPGVINSSTFEPRRDYYAVRSVNSMAIADVDGDGRNDIIAMGTDRFSVLRNSSSGGVLTAGSFANRMDFVGTMVNKNGIVVADVNGDGKPEVLTFSGYTVPSISIYRNTAVAGTLNESSFAAEMNIPIDFSGGAMTGVVLFDADGDGKNDIVFPRPGSSSVVVMKNQVSGGTIDQGSFAAGVSFATGGSPGALAIGDINGDGRLDMAVVNGSANNVAVLRNTGTAGMLNSSSFAAPVSFPLGIYAQGITINDIDGDGKPDMIISTGGSLTPDNFISIYRNDLLQPSPITGDTTVCTGVTTTLANPIGGGTWSSSNSAVATVGTGGTVTGVAAGVAIITYTYAGGTATAAINVQPVPAAITGVLSLCVDGNGTLSDAVPSGIWSSSNSAVATIGTNGAVAAIATGTVTISYTLGCGAPATAVVTVNALPEPISGTLATDIGSTTTLGNATAGGAWSSNDTTVATVTLMGVVTGKQPGSAIMNYSLPTGCSVPAVVMVNAAALPAPAISSVSATSGIPGAAVSITGTNFNTSLSSNAVYFGATKATVTEAGSTTLNVMVPDGATYKEISVRNAAAALTAYARSPFVPTYNASGYLPLINLQPQADLENGTYNNAVAIADIDGDGKADLIVAAPAYYRVSVFRNISVTGSLTASSFAPAVNLQLAPGSGGNMSGSCLAVEDIDGDGRPDIAVANANASNVCIFRNRATPGAITTASFDDRTDIAAGPSPQGIAISDLDNDGRPDMMVTSYTSNIVSVYRNTSTAGTITGSSFAARVDLATGTNPCHVTAADIDGDGRRELLVANTGDASFSIYRNISAPGTMSSSSFGPRVNFAAQYTIKTLLVGEIDGDGKPDVVAVTAGATNVYVYRNISAPGTIAASSLSSGVAMAAGGYAMYGALADMTGDGKADILVCNTTTGTLSILKNNASSGSITTSSFAAAANAGIGGYALAIGDLDGDDIPDIAVPYGTHATAVFRNQPLRISAPATICISTTKAYTHAVAGGTWSSSNSTIATVAATGVVTGRAAGRAIISYALPGGGYDTTSVLVLAPPAAITGVSAMCSGGFTIFSNTVAGGTWSISPASAFWSVDVMGFVTTGAWTTTNTATISYSVGCATVATKNLTIYASPDDITGISSLYPGSSTTLGQTVSGGTWSSSNSAVGTISSAGLFSAIAPGTATISYTLTGGCRATRTVTVQPTIQLPVITSVSPMVAKPDATINITGTNFDPVAAGNIVLFGATQATVTSASSTALTVTLPLGSTYAPVSVLNTTNGRTGYARYPFLPTYDNSAHTPGAIKLDPSVSFTAGNGTSATATADMDGDGKPDIIAVNSSSNTISIFQNTAASGAVTAGSLAAKADVATGASPISVAVGDIDGDGRPDIVVSNSSSATIGVLRNIHTSGPITSSSFAAMVSFAVPFYSTQGLAIGDIDGDGRPDIVGAGHNVIFIWRNTATQGTIDNTSLDAAISISSNATTGWHTAIADIDGDGKKDVVMTSAYNNAIAVFRNTSIQGYPSCATAVLYGAAGQPLGLAIGDIDGDGKADIAVSNGSGASIVSVFRNTATSGSITSSSLATRVDLAAGSTTRSVAIGDIDGDSKPDLVASADLGQVAVFRNIATPGTISTSSFAPRVSFAAGSGTDGIAVCDIDGDTLPDVVAANATGNISVLRNGPLTNSASISGTLAFCANATTALSHTTPGGTWSSANTGIATVGTSGVVTGMSAGAVVITYTLPGGGVATAELTLNPLPDPGIITNTATICTGSNIFLTSTKPSATEVWTTSDPSVAAIPYPGDPALYRLLSANAPGSAVITRTVSNECGSSTVTKLFTIITTPAAGTITGATTICASGIAMLSSTASVGTWSSSNTNVATVGSTGIVTGKLAGTTTITYTISNTCGTSTATRTVTVATATGAGTLTGAATVCAGATAIYSSTVTGGTWSSSNDAIGTIGTTGAVAGIAPGTATITYSVARSCGIVIATKTVTVTAIPAAGTITGSSVICPAATAAFSSTASGGVWSSNAAEIATVGSTGLVMGIAPGTASISYTISSGCGPVSATKVVTITATPGAITISGTDAICTTATAFYSSTADGGTWASSNAGIAAIGSLTGIVTGIAAGTSIISYTLNTGCGSTIATRTVTVNAAPAMLVLTGASSTCQYNSITLTASIPGGTWSTASSDIVTVSPISGVVTGAGAGSASISYTVTNSCGTSIAAKAVTVNMAPGIITGSLQACVGATGNLSVPSSEGSWTSMDAGIAVVGESGEITGIAPGTATIVYETAYGCTTSAVVTVQAALAAITGPATVVATYTGALHSTTPGGTWSSADEDIAIVDATTGVYTGQSAGVTTISYTTPGGCYSTKAVTVTAYINMDTARVCVGSSTMMNNYQGPGVWSSGSTAIATINAVTGVVTGVAAGTVYLTFTPATGTYSTRKITVNALPNNITGATQVCEGSTGTLLCSGSAGQWSSGNTGIGTIGVSSGVLGGVSDGTVNITFTIASSGCRRTTIVTVNAALPTISGSLSACVGATTVVSNASTGGTWSSTNTGRFTITASGVVTGISAGTAVVSYIHPTTCRTAAVITVNTAPATMTTIPAICAGSSATFTNSTPGGTWSATPGSGAMTIDATTGLAQGITPGTATISYALGTGCSRTAVAAISSSLPAISGNTNICTSASSALSIAAGSGTWASSMPAVATVIAGNGMVTGVAEGTATITYSVTGGCKATRVVTVSASPGSITGTLTVCSNGTTALGGTGSGVWSSSNTAAAVTDAVTGIVTGISAGSTIITRTNGTGCTRTATVTVKAAPNTITGSGTLCTGSSSTLINAGNTGSWSSSSTSVASIGIYSGVVSGISAGTATITYTNIALCQVARVVTVNTTATAGTISGPATVIAGSDITLSTTGQGGGTWSSSTTAVATANAATGVVTGISPGMATISYTVNNGCGPASSTYLVSVSASRSNTAQGAAGNTAALISIYPNPTMGAFSIRSAITGELAVYTIDGKEAARYEVPAGISALALPAQLPPGMYMCRFTTANGAIIMARLIYEQ